MDTALQGKWDRASRTYDFITRADERRYGTAKHRLFAKMKGGLGPLDWEGSVR